MANGKMFAPIAKSRELWAVVEMVDAKDFAGFDSLPAQPILKQGCVFMNKMGALIKQKLLLQAKLCKLAESHELTGEAVVRCSRELDKIIVQLQRRCVG